MRCLCRRSVRTTYLQIKFVEPLNQVVKESKTDSAKLCHLNSFTFTSEHVEIRFRTATHTHTRASMHDFMSRQPPDPQASGIGISAEISCKKLK